MKPVYIIAEAGVNHNGSLDLAFRLIDAAKEAGVDAVKFQTFRSENLVSKGAPKANYQKQNTGNGESQLEMLRKLELSQNDHFALIERCRSKGIQFLSTAFDFDSIDFLRSLNLGIWKIPSGEITNLLYLRKIGSYGERVIISTGMATMGEVEEAISVLECSGTPRDLISVLHCTTEYPAPLDEINLRSMITLGNAFGVDFGYSDHTQGLAVPIAAVALGASIIEKHFTLDKGMEGPDHKASLEPHELRSMVEAIRAVEVAMGDGIKRPFPSELANRAIARKSIVAARSIESGETFSAHNLTVKRPGTGISPMEWDRVIGRISNRHYSVDEAIEW